MPTGVFNADGSAGGLTHGLGAAPDNQVYVSGPNGLDEGLAEGTIAPGHVVVAGTADGEIAEAAAGATGPFKGIAHENDLKADDGSVLDAHADATNVAFYHEEGLHFACVADGAIPEDSEVEVGAVSGSVRALAAGTAVGRLVGKAAAADTDRIIVKYYGGKA